LLFLGENAFLLEGVLLRKYIIFSILGIWMTTKDTDDRPVVEQLPAGGETVNKDISRQRRKIIKASAAVVPAIMTIRSGAAAAAMTSLNGCINQDADRAAAEKVVYETPDEWVRVAGMEVTYKDNSTPNTTYIKLYGVPNDGVVPGTPEKYTDWYDKNGSTTDAKGKVYEVKKFEPEDKVVYLLVHVDIDPENNENNEFFMYPKDATLMSDQMTMDGSQITGSCMCSVNPNFTMANIK
jgi:hypothetical protein